MEFQKEPKRDKSKNLVTTFPVPFISEIISKNINISTDINFPMSEEEIIKKAIQFHLKGDIHNAFKLYEYYIRNDFENPIVFSNYSKILKEKGKINEAEKFLRKAIKLKPDFPDAYYNLGNTLKEQGKLKEAEIYFKKAIQIKPDLAEAYSNLGLIYEDLNKIKEAAILFEKSIEINPDLAEAYSNLGSINHELNDLDRAEKLFKRAIKLKPDFAEAYFNLGYINLLKGDYKTGLELFEFRNKIKNEFLFHANPKIERINDINLQEIKKLLVVSEQGLGDTIQYMRYLPYLKSKGIKVSFCAQKKLHSLIKASGINSDPITSKEANLVSEGRWIPLLSLPKCLHITPRNPIINSRYIYSTNELVMKWKNILANEKRPIIGINWQGNKNIEKGRHHGRSIPLEAFSFLFEKNDISILSLQKGFGSEQLKNCSFKNKFIACQNEIDNTWDFLENAAIIENCDLIITSDTSIAHLAGGMGKNVWLLLKDIPFWTWGLEGESTFWYPTMRLFRQKEKHNWKEVFKRVSVVLNNEIENNFRD